MLSLEQSNDFRRFKKLFDFLKAFLKVFQGFEPFKDEANDLFTNFGIFDALIPNKNVLVTSVTEAKEAKKTLLINKAVFISKKAMAFAKKKKDKILEAKVKITKDTIVKLKEAEVEALIIGFVDVIKQQMLPDTLFKGYLITNDTLNDLLKLAADFKTAIGTPAGAANTVTVANTQIDDVIEKLDGNLEQLDLLVDYFAETDPAFVEGFHLNSEAEVLGVQHNGVHGTVVNAVTKEPIVGATVAVVGSKKKVVTNVHGAYDMERVRIGTKTIEASAKGFLPKRADNQFKRGKKDDLDFELEPVV